MKIGVLGGSFDPIHLGHLQLAEAAIASLELDEVIFVPAARNPLKRKNTGSATQKQRLAMVQEAVKPYDKFSVSDIEMSRGGNSYTVETLSELQYVKPGDYWLILGSDSLKGFTEWKNYLRLIRQARLAVALRPPNSMADVQLFTDREVYEKVDWIEMKPAQISSTEIRHRLEEGKPIAQWLPESVNNYIRENKLY